MTLTQDFVFSPKPAVRAPGAGGAAAPAPAAQLTSLEALVGPWSGTGFNTIWRPHFPKDPQDRFLELDLTQERLVVHRIKGQIPNRGLDQPDIEMTGVHYLQQISDTAGNGLHIEPGIWALVPPTEAPEEPQTVVRMASIPHGTVILAQGVATISDGPPTIPDVNIIPFPIPSRGTVSTPPPNSAFASAAQTFPELDLSTKTQFREPADASSVPGITQEMVENPSVVLREAMSPHIVSTTTLQVTTTDKPVRGGGTRDTDFLAHANADATEVSSTFWLETVKEPGQTTTSVQLQYLQVVMLDFNGLRWPHVTVATMTETDD